MVLSILSRGVEMPAMTFRFTTECEMTLNGASYEDIYLQFKDFLHGDMRVPRRAQLAVSPPESVQLYFHIDGGPRHEIEAFRGDFQRDIRLRCDEHELEGQALQATGRWRLDDAVLSSIPTAYW